jgi:hypothetical protein
LVECHDAALVVAHHALTQDGDENFSLAFGAREELYPCYFFETKRERRWLSDF